MPLILVASVSGQHVAVMYDAAVLSRLERAGYVSSGAGPHLLGLNAAARGTRAEAAICAT
jgi:hypothetical protein